VAQTPFFDSQTSTDRIFTSWIPAAVIASMCSSSIIVPCGTISSRRGDQRSSAVERPRCGRRASATTWPASTMAAHADAALGAAIGLADDRVLRHVDETAVR
jgi:hypothetical protein